MLITGGHCGTGTVTTLPSHLRPTAISSQSDDSTKTDFSHYTAQAR
ncbi:MAG: hypothetical protein MSA13_05490 [Prevotella sp.]|nr:hypothetical protein [Prevotella sp.]